MKRGSVCKPSTGLSPAAISSCCRPCQEKQTAPGHTEWTQCRKTGDVPTLFIFDASTAHYEPQRRRLNFCSKIQISVDFLVSSKNKQADFIIHVKRYEQGLCLADCILLGSVFSECLQKIGLHVSIVTRGAWADLQLRFQDISKRLLLNSKIRILTEAPLKQSCNAYMGQERVCVLFLETEMSKKNLAICGN